MRKDVVSHFQKSYWLDRGYSEKDYYKIIRKLNPQLEEFYDNREEFLNFKERFSDIMRDVWYRELPNKKFFNLQSKEEIYFFKNIKEHINYINHTPFYVNLVEEDSKYTFIFDGYIKIDDKIILIEYDGLYWHDLEKDLFRDQLTIKRRDDIIGIIRFSDNYVKSNNFDTISSNIKEYLSNPIDRILFY